MQMRSAMEAQAEEVDRLTQQAKDAQAAAAQEATREQAAQGQLGDAQSAVQSERAAVAKGEDEKKMLRGLMATAHREQEQEAARADSLSAQAGALQRQLAAANANATRWKAAVAELTAEKKASAQDSDQFFETAAKMQNKNDELTAQLAQQGAALQLAASDKSTKFTEGQLLEKIQGKDAQLRQEAQLLAAAQENERRYAAQVKLLQPHNKFPRAAAKKVAAPRAAGARAVAAPRAGKRAAAPKQHSAVHVSARVVRVPGPPALHPMQRAQPVAQAATAKAAAAAKVAAKAAPAKATPAKVPKQAAKKAAPHPPPAKALRR